MATGGKHAVGITMNLPNENSICIFDHFKCGGVFDSPRDSLREERDYVSYDFFKQGI